jgi:hypothetical protein
MLLQTIRGDRISRCGLRAPAEEVFAYMTDVENLPEWATRRAKSGSGSEPYAGRTSGNPRSVNGLSVADGPDRRGGEYVRAADSARHGCVGSTGRPPPGEVDP